MKYINEMIAFATGGGLLAVFNYFRDTRKDKVDEFVVLLEKYKSTYQDQEERIQALEEKILAKDKEYRELHVKYSEALLKINELTIAFHRMEVKTY